jgi:hypothetical protein
MDQRFRSIFTEILAAAPGRFHSLIKKKTGKGEYDARTAFPYEDSLTVITDDNLNHIDDRIRPVPSGTFGIGDDLPSVTARLERMVSLIKPLLSQWVIVTDVSFRQACVVAGNRLQEPRSSCPADGLLRLLLRKSVGRLAYECYGRLVAG